MSPDTFLPRLPLCEQVCLVLSIPSADTALPLYVTDDFPTRVCLPLYPVSPMMCAIFLVISEKTDLWGKKIKFYHHDRDPGCNTDPDIGASRVPHKC
jgi:hypothetical protein